MNVRKLIIFVGCVVKAGKTDDLLIIETARFAALGIDLELWDASRIYGRLSGAPQVVSTHLGRDYHAKLFGDSSAPFADLQRELLRGDMAGKRAIGLIARLNQAESAELKELKRRVQHGEADAVYEQLEDMLHQAGVSDAIAPQVRAGMERLLAALAIARADYIYAKLLLDRADGRDGEQAPRLRAMLVLESEGADALLAFSGRSSDEGTQEVRAVARLRNADPAGALDELAGGLAADRPSSESLRLSALAHLLLNDRERGLELARQSVQRDPEAHAVKHALAVVLFNAALSPSVQPELGEWPQPVDLAFVQSGDLAQVRLAEAEEIFGELASARSSASRDMATAWHIASMTLRRGRRDAAQAAVSGMEAASELTPAVVAWAISHALTFDQVRAAERLDRRIANNNRDLQAILVRVALANQMADHLTARALLATHKSTFCEAGHDDIFDYWTAIIDLETRRPPNAAVLRKYPWLDLRAAIGTRARKSRLTAIGKVVERQAKAGGDRRVLLAGAQLLLEGGWYKLVAKHSRMFLESVGTAEAVVVAAQALHRAGDQIGALRALDAHDAFPESKLPVSMARLRVVCLAAAGRVAAAAQESAILATQTHLPQDLWSSINYHISMGAVPDALAIWHDNAATLTEPSPGHIMLARAAIHVDPDAARRITAQIVSNVPDALVTAAFDLSAKLRMREQSDLMRRIVLLGSNNSAGVMRIDSVEQALAMIKERQQAIDKARVTYNQGHAPIHLLASWRSGTVAAAHLGSIGLARARRSAGDILGARYGRRYDPAIWPTDRRSVKLIADVTALLTGQHLDLLDRIERAFKPIHIGPDSLNALAAMRGDLDEMQPDRLEAMRAVASRLKAGELNEDGNEHVDPFTVLWTSEDGEPNSTLNLTRLVDLLRPLLPADRSAEMMGALGNTIDEAAHGAMPPDNAIVTIEAGMAVLLEQAGMLAYAAGHLRLHVARDQIAVLDIQIQDAEERATLIEKLGGLYDRIATGVADGAYAFVPPVKERYRDPLQASMMQALAATAETDSILWVDDRLIASIDNSRFQVVTSAEVIDALQHYRRISLDQVFALRQRLRAIDWMFLPLRSDEVLAHLRSALDGDTLRETQDLALLRRGMGAILRHRRLLQWPDPKAVEKGVRGEVPFLLDLGHMVAETIGGLWTAKDLSIEAAACASSWVLEHLDVDQYPMPVLPAGDPRSDQLQGLRLAHLILHGLQIIPVKAMKERQRQYLAWVWNEVVGPRLEERPEMFESMMEMMEQHLLGADDPTQKVSEQELWRDLAGSFLNALPQPFRDRVLSRSAFVAGFGLEGHGTITIGGASADEMDFWQAIAALEIGKSVPLDLKEGKAAILTLEATGEADHHIRVELGQGGYRIDDWPWRASHDDPKVRRAALAERVDLIDMSDNAMVALNEELGSVADRAQRVRRAEQASADAMPAWHAAFATKVAEQHGFALYELMPDRAEPTLAWLRFGAGEAPEAAARRINDERGLLAMIDRIAPLSIDPDPSVVAIFVEAPETDRAEAVRYLSDLPPWHALFVVKLMQGAGVSDKKTATRMRAALLAATTGARAWKEWQLFWSMARYVASHAPQLADWTSIGAEQQLAFVWAHASKLSVSLIAAQVDPASVAAYLDKAILFSPRDLVEKRLKYLSDAADPNTGSASRLRVRASLRALLAFNNGRTSGPAHRALKQMLFDENSEVVGATRLLPSALAPSIFASSFFSADFGSEVGKLFPGVQFSFGVALNSVVLHALGEPADSGPFRKIWTYLRQASGDAPLSSEINRRACERVAELKLTDVPDRIEMALHTIIAVAALAAVNDWQELRERIDHAVETLWPLSGAVEQKLQIFFEIANWRARIERVSYERGRVVTGALRRIASIPENKDWSIMVARRFAGTLSGHDAEPFVDYLAEYRT